MWRPSPSVRPLPPRRSSGRQLHVYPVMSVTPRRLHRQLHLSAPRLALAAPAATLTTPTSTRLLHHWLVPLCMLSRRLLQARHRETTTTWTTGRTSLPQLHVPPLSMVAMVSLLLLTRLQQALSWMPLLQLFILPERTQHLLLLLLLRLLLLLL
jgi:hypothetical protein